MPDGLLNCTTRGTSCSEEPPDPDEPAVPDEPEEPPGPASPLLAKDINKSKLFVKPEPAFETKEQSTSKCPICVTIELMTNNIKLPGTPLCDILKCPLIVFVESSIVDRKSVMLDES